MSGKYKFSSFADWKGISIIILSVLGLLLSLYLTKNFYSGSEFSYCITGTECDVVKKSVYSKIMGLPVSVVGIIGYALILLTALFSLSKRKKWNYLFIFTTIGFAFSVYLTYLELVVIKAVCSYCIASALLITLILALVLLKKDSMSPKMSLAKSLILFLFLTSTVFAGSYSLQSSDNEISSKNLKESSSEQLSLAKHLSSNGAVMYGAYNCPHCLDQKRMFGKAFEYIDYVECNSNGPNAQPSLCFAKGIRRYPTWQINGRYYEGELTLNQLSEITNFKQ